MALDYGRRRIGVAASDPSRTIASPHATVPNRDPPGEPPAELLRLLRNLEPALILVGVPIDMDGGEGPMALESRRFGRRLAGLTGLPVLERDERLTTFAAGEVLRQMNLPKRRRREKGRKDMLAATLLLQDYLAEG